MYVRFVTRRIDPAGGRAEGLFTAAYTLKDAGLLEPHEVAWFAEVVGWFERHLAVPKAGALFRARSPGERDRTLFWFKSEAHEHVQRMQQVGVMLGHHGIPARMLRSARPGRIVYEDQHQVGAVPYRDTRA